MRHTIRSLNESSTPPIVGDVAYLMSPARITPQVLGKLARHLPEEQWFKEVTARSGITIPTRPHYAGWLALELLRLQMLRQGVIMPPTPGDPFELIKTAKLPAWIKNLSPLARRYLIEQYAITDGVTPLGIVPHFPHVGFGYIVADDELASDAAQVFTLHRLAEIKQLSFLHDPVLRGIQRNAAAMMFDHTRYLHSLDVYVIGRMIAHNLGLKGSTLNTLLTALITHDALTPAGGDSVKLIDLAAFDEDANYPELLQGEAWDEYQRKWDVDRELLIATIKGEGLLGSILDVADKSAYVARDTFAYLGSFAPKVRFDSTGFTAIQTLATGTENICGIWESARLINGILAFRNQDKIEKFLTLRALMFRELYYNPYSRFFEYLIGRGVAKYLYVNKMITREELLSHGDWWIERKIEEFLESAYVLHKFHNLENALIEEHEDLASAEKRAREFDDDDSRIVIVDNFQVSTSTGAKRFNIARGRTIVPFATACERANDEITRIMTFPKAVRLYIFVAADLDIPASGRQRIKTALRSV